jgi:hypothetical protein
MVAKGRLVLHRERHSNRPPPAPSRYPREPSLPPVRTRPEAANGMLAVRARDRRGSSTTTVTGFSALQRASTTATKDDRFP